MAETADCAGSGRLNIFQVYGGCLRNSVPFLAGLGSFPLRPHGTAVPGFHMPPLRSWSGDRCTAAGCGEFWQQLLICWITFLLR